MVRLFGYYFDHFNFTFLYYKYSLYRCIFHGKLFVIYIIYCLLIIALYYILFAVFLVFHLLFMCKCMCVRDGTLPKNGLQFWVSLEWFVLRWLFISLFFVSSSYWFWPSSDELFIHKFNASDYTESWIVSFIHNYRLYYASLFLH